MTLLQVCLRRLAFAVPVLVLVSAAIFALGKASPFDPVTSSFGERILRASPDQVEQIRAQWGVDEPAGVQYLAWAGRLLQGDLGDSRLFHQPVVAVLGDRLGWSVLLAGVGLVLALVVSVVLGVWSARRGTDTWTWRTGAGRYRHVGEPPAGAEFIPASPEYGYLLLTCPRTAEAVAP